MIIAPGQKVVVMLLVVLTTVNHEWDCQCIIFSGIANPRTLAWLNIRNGRITFGVLLSDYRFVFHTIL